MKKGARGKRKPGPQPGDRDARIVMWAEHREEPDWDKLVKVIVEMAMEEAR